MNSKSVSVPEWSLERAKEWVESFADAVRKIKHTTQGLQREVWKSTRQALVAGGYVASESGEVVSLPPVEEEAKVSGSTMYRFPSGRKVEGNGATVGAISAGGSSSSVSASSVPSPLAKERAKKRGRRPRRRRPRRGRMVGREEWEEVLRMAERVHDRAGDVEIEVVEGDMLEVAERMVAQAGPQSRVAVLNMASATIPGGAYTRGASAQEENFMRRSDYSLYLAGGTDVREARDWEYPLPEPGGVYTECVRVFRGPQREGYPFLETPFCVGGIAVAAPKHPRLNREGRLDRKEMARLTLVLRSILQIAIIHGHRHVVLSAIGCGAYGNPPQDVAETFARLLLGPEGLGVYFEAIVFVVYDDHNAYRAHNPRGNLLPFQEVFG